MVTQITNERINSGRAGGDGGGSDDQFVQPDSSVRSRKRQRSSTQNSVSGAGGGEVEM
jgi:hypothetical protein